jgi:hypothetical protein
MKQFDGALSGANEDKNIAWHRVLSHHITDKSAETVKAFAHVGRLAVKKKPVRGCDGGHDRLIFWNNDWI